MAYIKVDHSRFEATANAMDTYVSSHKSHMNKANTEITDLSKAWQGADYNQFKSKWNQVMGKNSISQKMISAMEDYAKFLRFSANTYKQAQANAVNGVNSIPRA